MFLKKPHVCCTFFVLDVFPNPFRPQLLSLLVAQLVPLSSRIGMDFVTIDTKGAVVASANLFTMIVYR